MMNTQELAAVLEATTTDVAKLTFDECNALLNLDKELNPVVTNPTRSYQSLYTQLRRLLLKEEMTEDDQRLYNTLTTDIWEQKRQCLEILPDETIEKIGSYLVNSMQVNNALGQTCSHLYNICLFKRNASALEKAEIELWDHVMRDEQAQAERIIKALPFLLTRKRGLYQGCEIQRTVLQIAVLQIKLSSVNK